MPFPINAFRPRITDLCRRYRVRRLDMFGSALREDFDERASDLDFLVEFLEREPEGAADRYFDLRHALQTELQRPVDLVMRNAVRNPYFLRAVDDTRLNLYASPAVHPNLQSLDDFPRTHHRAPGDGAATPAHALRA
jgi:predicted nucleotidyltransferase